MPLARVNRWIVQRGFHTLCRTVGAETVTVQRPVRKYSNLGGQRLVPETLYKGEALEITTSGQVENLGLGQIETYGLTLVIPSAPGIEQGDIFTYRKHRYQVEDVTDVHRAALVLRCKQLGQEEQT